MELMRRPKGFINRTYIQFLTWLFGKRHHKEWIKGDTLYYADLFYIGPDIKHANPYVSFLAISKDREKVKPDITDLTYMIYILMKSRLCFSIKRSLVRTKASVMSLYRSGQQ